MKTPRIFHGVVHHYNAVFSFDISMNCFVSRETRQEKLSPQNQRPQRR